MSTQQNIFATLLLALALVSCGGGGSSSDEGASYQDNDSYTENETDHDNDDNDLNTTPVNTVTDAANLPDGSRLLASQCFQCHGTEGISVSGIESLREESYEIEQEMLEMKYSNDADDIMYLHAKGYNEDEIQRISLYFRSLYGD